MRPVAAASPERQATTSPKRQATASLERQATASPVRQACSAGPPAARKSTAQAPWAAGLGLAMPVMLGYVPVAFAFGVLGHTAGLPGWATAAMSLFVYGGSSQFAALQLITVGAAPYAVILTTFVVNLRHLLFAASVAPRLAGWRRVEQAAFAYELTDEAFAVHSAQYAERAHRSKAEVFAFNAAVHASWVTGTVLGTLAGDLVHDVEALGLDYALPAMFMALLAAGIVADLRSLAVAVTAGTGAVALTLLGLQYWSVVLAAAAAATLGLAMAPRDTQPADENAVAPGATARPVESL
ncbi:AzlC family ABC transporter permease [Streptomyces actinomycinicus]|uniref:AzlC family ABC transporter permease n=1 Tax=Streptomyces actinomycinicus TaxID=1695166 RepID=A0A937EJL4_9ACTN|nr:AzlC family ABC transporter permease [Streptomyces actinomycinicus]MBL1083663.1 AzlC family ABC transporter permease [Streptomyces actinomycinicus]